MMISFVIPTLNQAGFIRQCIDSCLAFDFEEYEVIVVDGASTDETQNILSEYGNRIQWVSESDQGQSDALNKGILRTRGEIIAWINSDDYYPDNNSLRNVMSLFEEDSTLDIVYGDGLMVDIEGVPIKRLKSFELSSAKELLLCAGICICQPALFFRRQLFFDAGSLTTGCHWAMDLDLWLRMFPLARRTLYLNSVLACVTSHPQAKSIYGMLAHIREIRVVLNRHRGRFSLNPIERLKLWWGEIGLYLYWLAVKLKTKRVT